MNNEFFIEQLSKEFNISQQNTIKLLNKLKKMIKNQQVQKQPVTKNFLARIIIHNLRKIRQEEENIKKTRLLSVFSHSCLEKHYKKFLELYKEGWGAKRIENYFKNHLKCSISKSYLDKVLKFLREQEKENG
jgi:Glu-tRNA(Gln) amidotransferase subunit E-like FAD-binding protein